MRPGIGLEVRAACRACSCQPASGRRRIVLRIIKDGNRILNRTIPNFWHESVVSVLSDDAAPLDWTKSRGDGIIRAPIRRRSCRVEARARRGADRTGIEAGETGRSGRGRVQEDERQRRNVL